MSEQTEQRRAEVRALARLAGEELGLATGGIGSIHRAFADHVFGAVALGVGPWARGVKVAHDAVAGAVYAGVSGAARTAGAAAGAAARVVGTEGPPPSGTSKGAFLIGTIQGLRGDALEEERSPLAPPMSVRVGGVPVEIERGALAEAFPQATGRIVVFLHGLMETEASWGIGGRPSYGERLQRELGMTAIPLRYNSGRHISQNGRSLAELMERLVDEWPVPVGSIALVGHSMGGLVARSGCCWAAEQDREWVRSVRHIVSLGTPHLGAPLEQLVHLGSAALDVLPETRPFARFLRRRSGGIRDLRQGSLVDEDWSGRDPDALRSAACREVPLLPGATHCFVSATITRSPRHPLGRLLGDLLVLTPSATGRGRTRRLGFSDEFGLHVSPASHFALLNHPAVYAKLREWLAPKPVALLPAGPPV